MKFTALELLETYVSSAETHSVALGDYAPGIHCTNHAFFKKEADGSIPWVVSRSCDHAGGKLRFCDGDSSKAICPLHNWEFDFNNLSYTKIPNQTFEHITKNSLPFSVKGNTLTYETEQLNLRVPSSIPQPKTPIEVELRFITHASVMLELNGLKLLTDPWYVGECLAGGWWLKQPPKADAWELLKSADLLYISHNHPDHLHTETLAHAHRDIPIIVPKFDTDSVTTPLRDLGFTNIHELELKRLYRVNNSELLISILPTGDHRDDSGLFVVQGDFSAVLTVDCVGTNQYVLPQDISILLTNFASGASGWPLCYEVVGSLDERAKIVTKNRGNAVLEVMKYIAATKPRVYMPYAGFFDERAPRDHTIKTYNVKNSSASIVEKVTAKFPMVQAIDPLLHDRIHWKNGEAMVSNIDQPPLFTYDATTITHYLDAQRKMLKKFDIEKIAEYFSQSEFKDDLIVYLALTDDDYTPTGPSLRIDFSTTPITHKVIDGPTLLAQFNALTELNGKHHLLIKARTDSLWRLVHEGRPLEELTLGFQCRIDRKPDQYSAAFWQHYTTHGAPMLKRGEDRLLYKLLEGSDG
ncbi:MAG: MBL fold metallo-hydrolase [Rickettsiales bacterium]